MRSKGEPDVAKSEHAFCPRDRGSVISSRWDVHTRIVSWAVCRYRRLRGVLLWVLPRRREKRDATVRTLDGIALYYIDGRQCGSEWGAVISNQEGKVAKDLAEAGK